MLNKFRLIVSEVKEVGSARSSDNLERRLCKLYEELGELSEAYLGVTCPSNLKNKTIDDLREEAIDCMIVALDCALTQVDNSTVVAALLPHVMESELRKPFTVAEVQDAIFKMGESNARAIVALKEKDYPLYFGAINSVVRYATQISFIDRDAFDPKRVDEIKSVFETKMNKWRKALAIYKEAA